MLLEDENAPTEIWGVEVSALIKYLYLIFYVLIALNLVFSFNPNPETAGAYRDQVRSYEQRVEFLQTKITSSMELSDEEYEEVLAELRVLQDKLRSAQQTASSGVLAFLAILGFVGFCHFCFCVYIYLMHKEDLGEVLESHAGYMWMLQVAYFVLGLILLPILGFIPLLSFLLVAAFVASQAFFVSCGFTLYQDDEEARVAALKERGLLLIETAKNKINEARSK